MKYLIYFAYHPDGLIEPHVHHMLAALRPQFEVIHLVHNGPLAPGQTVVADLVQERPNEEFDVGAYRDALAAIASERLDEITELTLANFTFFGPMQDFQRVFNWAEAQDVDFWGVSAHGSVTPNPFTGQGDLPYHLNSHWISVRAPMLHSAEFRNWWQTRPPITSYEDSVLHHESQFTRHFSDLGYTHAALVEPRPGGSAYPAFDEVQTHPDTGLPILKRRLFYHQPTLYADAQGANPRAALERSGLDTALVWPSVVREAPPWTIYQNADLLFIFPDVSFGAPDEAALHVVTDGAVAMDLAKELLPPGTHIDQTGTWLGHTEMDAAVLYVCNCPEGDQRYGLSHIARDAAVRTHARRKLAEPGIGLALPVMRAHGRDAEIGSPFDPEQGPRMASTSGVAWVRSGLLRQALSKGVPYADLPEFVAAQGFATICVSNTADLPRNHVKLEGRHRAMAGRIGRMDPFEAQAFFEHLLELASSEGVERARAELAKQAHDFGFQAGFEQGFDHGFRDGWQKARTPLWRRRA